MTTRADTFTATPFTLDCIAELVVMVRPSWDQTIVRAVLMGHASKVDGADLAIAALRCATNLDFHTPKAIGWRGPHWDGLTTTPPEVQHAPRCQVCHKPEPRCYGERPGIGDDHVFEPPRPSEAIAS